MEACLKPKRAASLKKLGVFFGDSSKHTLDLSACCLLRGECFWLSLSWDLGSFVSLDWCRLGRRACHPGERQSTLTNEPQTHDREKPKTLPPTMGSKGKGVA